MSQFQISPVVVCRKRMSLLVSPLKSFARPAAELGAVDWLIVNNCPPTVRVPVRANPVPLAATEKLTVVLPVPEAALVRVMNDGVLLAALQAQGVVSEIVPVPPAAE